MAEVVFLLETPTPQRTPVLDELAGEGIDLVALYRVGEDSSRGWGGVRPAHPHATIRAGLWRSCVQVARTVLADDTRVLCCFGYRAPAFALAILVARARGVRVVTRSDSNWLRERQRPGLRRFAKRLFLRSLFGKRTRVWTVGTQNDRYWSYMRLPDRHLIPYGMPYPPVGTPAEGAEFRRAHGLGEGLVVLFVGMLEPWKGVTTLLEAFAGVSAPTARLVIVGKGSLAPVVERAARDDPRIVVCGSRTQQELGAVYAAADLLVLPSTADAWGLVVDEAQANGVRVVVSDVVGAAADRIDDDNGWVFPVGDAEALAAIMRGAVLSHTTGWPRLAPSPPYNAAPAMLAELRRMGVAVRADLPARNSPQLVTGAGDGAALDTRRAGWPSA